MSFTWNGINCESLGLTVEKFPPRPIPNRKVAAYSILGRNGDLLIDYNSYDNVIQEYEVFVKETSNSMQANIQAIAAWLVGVAGYRILTDSYDTTIYRYARVENAVEFVNSLNKFGRGVIEFNCKPQRWKNTEAALTGVIGNTFTIPTEATQPGYPLMTLQTIAANCSFRVEDTNGLRIVIPARGVAIAKIEIDWENQTVLNKYNDSVPTLTSVSGKWGTLGDGDQIITTLESGASPTVSIQPRRFFI